MSQKADIGDFVFLGVLGYCAWQLVGIAIGDGLFSGLFGGSSISSTAWDGTVTLQPRVPYRLTFESDASLASADDQSALRAELLPFSPYDVAITAAAGRWLVSYSMLPAFPIPISIGARLSADGQYAPSLTLISVSRLDGKAI